MSSKSRRQMKKETELEVLDYLRSQSEAVSFYQLYTDLNYTSGKAQSAIKRLQEQGAIHIRKKIDKFKTFIWDKDFELEPDPLELEDENTIIFPVRLNRIVGTIFQEIPNVSPNHGSFVDLVKEAIIYYFQTKIPDELKAKAIQNAIKNGTITEELGKKILGG